MVWDGPTRSNLYEGAVGMLLIALLLFDFLRVAHAECYVVVNERSGLSSNFILWKRLPRCKFRREEFVQSTVGHTKFKCTCIGNEFFRKRDGITLMRFTEKSYYANIQISKDSSAIVSTND